MFSYAVKMGVVSENPFSKVTIPKGEVKVKQIYSQEELELLLSKLIDEPTKYRVFFYLISYTGLRRSEMLGLEWKDIDFEHNVISVRRTSNYTAERGTYADTTKTKRSQRTLKISPFIMNILKQLKEEQEQVGRNRPTVHKMERRGDEQSAALRLAKGVLRKKRAAILRLT